MNGLATLERKGRVAVLTLRRPDARNALSLDLLSALHACVDQAASETDAAAMLVTGEGKAFCAGMDLKAVLDEPGMPLRLLSSLAELCGKLRALPLVTLAKVNGAAIGGGCGLATVCDLAVTHADAKLGFPEVDLGVCPAVVAPWLVRKIGAGKARRVLLSGGLMSGAKAHELGIADHCVATAAELDSAADEIAQRLATGGRQALRATKQLLNELDGSLDAHLSSRAAELSARVLENEETRATLRAKLSK